MGAIPYNPETHTLQAVAITDERDGVISSHIEYSLLKKSDEEIREIVTANLIASEKPEEVETYGVTGFDIDSMILQKFFAGDRGREIGFTQRMIYLQIKERTESEETEMQIILAGYEKKEAFKNLLKTLNS